MTAQDLGRLRSGPTRTSRDVCFHAAAGGENGQRASCAIPFHEYAADKWSRSQTDGGLGSSPRRALRHRRCGLPAPFAGGLARGCEGPLQRGQVVGLGQHRKALAHGLLRA